MPKWYWQHRQADAQQPAFSNLFVQTEILTQQQCNTLYTGALAQRMKNRLGYFISWQNTRIKSIVFPTKLTATQFIGRGRTVVNPIAMEQNWSSVR